MDGLICEDKLPETQSEVVTALVKDIKWILADEITFAMIRSPGGIEAETLQRVAAHVDMSAKKPGNACHSIPLNFVFGKEK